MYIQEPLSSHGDYFFFTHKCANMGNEYIPLKACGTY